MNFSLRNEIHKFAYCDWFFNFKKLASYGAFKRKTHLLEEIFNIGYQAAKESYQDSIFSK